MNSLESFKKNKNIPYLDGWRGLAIILVLLCHFGNREYKWIGEFGVMLFFALSGYLMSYLLFIKEVSLKDFFARRISRIVPTFWLYIAVALIYSYFFQPKIYKVPISEVISSMLFMRTYFPSTIDLWWEWWPIGHFWSLNVEEHSYIFLAIVTFFCRRNKPFLKIVLVASTVTAFAIGVYYGAISPPSGKAHWFVRSECASLGLLAAATLRMLRETSSIAWLKRTPSSFPIFTFVMAMACFSPYMHSGIDKLIAPLFVAVTVVYLDQLPALLRTALSHPVMRWFGFSSFSLYIWQQPFFVASQQNVMPGAIAGCFALMVGTASFYLFEDPVRRFLNRKWSNRGHASSGALLPLQPQK